MMYSDTELQNTANKGNRNCSTDSKLSIGLNEKQ